MVQFSNLGNKIIVWSCHMFHHGCKTYFQDWMKIVILVLTNNISPSMLGLWHAWKTFIMDFMLQNWRSCPKFNINQLRDIISERFWTYLEFRGVNLLVLILNIPLSMVIYPKISLCSIPSLITGSVFDLPPNFPSTPHISRLSISLWGITRNI